MSLSTYLHNLVENFKDSRIQRNITALVQKLIEHKTIRLWTVADDKREYERYRNLINGELKSVVTADTTAAALRQHAVDTLAGERSLIALHDICDIRKADAQQMENMGTVRDLDGNLINGYQTFDSIVLDPTGETIVPSDITVFSNGDDHFVTVTELEAYQKGQLQESDDPAVRARAAQIERYLAEDSLINIRQVTQAQLRRVSERFKAQHPEVTLCHVLDRQFDGLPYFTCIDAELQDEFVIRLKISRNANATVTDAQSGQAVSVKLKDAPFAQQHEEMLSKLRLRQRVYQDVTRRLEWDTLTLEGNTYNVVRVTLIDRKGQAIYEHPMLLITNRPVTTAAQAQRIYEIYLLRAQSEAVFKFLKTTLGWEEFQVRDFESIQNLIALCFFVGAYFYAIGSALTDSAILQMIAQLGGGKGRVTRHYVFQGLQRLLVHRTVTRFLQTNGIDQAGFASMMAFVT